ncbi:putative uncharacterized protein [Tetragenococcus halophilus subsp. halophilus]|uniref:hypothetical protein n=1 Tax=Tetragenococcus halophilus TaxID=51669 RepID=UPI000CB40197|nr:hypothetical protein [Tetragenococcus halophilus]GBD74014.1 putative uncharacterized protein [Tetragenococcus halophilus subsp. halophilus]GBD76422.1 putative uncharacterized protein [Tetragenococcus halophilus subsp. halophilus]
MRTIYKKITNSDSEAKFQQRFLAEGVELPEGWTEDFEELDLPEDEPTEIESMQQQIVDLQEIVSDISGGASL